MTSNFCISHTVFAPLRFCPLFLKGNSIDVIAPNKAKYDKNIKELLADVQILSRIVKYTVEEVQHMTLDEIMDCIDQNSIQIGNIPIDPGYTNTGRVTALQAENAVPGES